MNRNKVCKNSSKHSNIFKNIWSKLTKRKCRCTKLEEGSTKTGRMEEEGGAITGATAPIVDLPNIGEEDEEEDVKMSAEMAALAVARPHTQVDYIHHLVPNLTQITTCSFYWGKMDRYEAEGLLEGQPEGSFLLRDSAQDEYIFSVSFRRYGRSLHARIEESGHKFSFDCHDPGVFMSRNIPVLLQHYKDPLSCMFFEPMLCRPVPRRQPFSLQKLARPVICDSLSSYSDIDSLELPRSLKVFLKEYHYRHKSRVRRYDV